MRTSWLTRVGDEICLEACISALVAYNKQLEAALNALPSDDTDDSSREGAREKEIIETEHTFERCSEGFAACHAINPNRDHGG